MKKIIITGTPGTGKTTVSNKLSETFKCEVLSINDIVINKNYTHSFDNQRNTYIVNPDKLIPYLKKKVKYYKKINPNCLVIEGHYADILPKDLIDYIFILRCHPEILKLRLEKKNVKEESIKENVQAEILGNSVNHILERFEELKDIPLMEINTSNRSINKVSEIIWKIVHNKINQKEFQVGGIDWLEEISENDDILNYF